MYVFNRSISVNVKTLDENQVSVDGIFLDSYHELCLNLVVEMNGFTIVDAKGEFRRIPHPDCNQAEGLIVNLVGLKLEHGVRKQIQEAVGKQRGCTHLSDLALECVKALVQAKYSLMHLDHTPEEIEDLSAAYLKGTCYHYRETDD